MSNSKPRVRHDWKCASRLERRARRNVARFLAMPVRVAWQCAVPSAGEPSFCARMWLHFHRHLETLGAQNRVDDTRLHAKWRSSSAHTVHVYMAESRRKADEALALHRYGHVEGSAELRWVLRGRQVDHTLQHNAAGEMVAFTSYRQVSTRRDFEGERRVRHGDVS